MRNAKTVAHKGPSPVKRWLLCSILGAVATTQSRADAGFPWNFDMSPDQVAAVKAYAPYRNFKNGDIETLTGPYDGHTENIQFFFTDNRLRRIGVYMYEGHDIREAGQKWLEAHDSLLRRYGSIETPSNHAPSLADETSRQSFADAARAIVADKGKTQMAPIKQPADARVFASFQRNEIDGERLYLVTVYFDRPM